MSKEKKYISLKEAAKLSGYSADYVGQLIRSGKLEGKQVFSNVAWMTTEEAISKYILSQGGEAISKSALSVLLDKMRSSISITGAFTAVQWIAMSVLGLFIVFLISILAIAIDHKIERGYVQQLQHAGK